MVYPHEVPLSHSPRHSAIVQGDLIAFNRGITSCEKATAWRAALRLLQLLAEEERFPGREEAGNFPRKAAGFFRREKHRMKMEV